MSRPEFALLVLASFVMTSFTPTSFVKERFGVPSRSSILRFLHLPISGAVVPKTITSTTKETRSVNEPALCVATGTGETAGASGGLTASVDGAAVVAGIGES